MEFHDLVAIAGTRRREDGALLVDARVARTGVQEYRGFEVGKPEQAMVRVYRPEAEVFSTDAMRTYAHRPVTMDHPRDPVTADNWKEVAIGQTGEEVVRDGSFVRVPMMISDAAAIKAVEDGNREISMGYAAELVWQDGTTPEGEQYDAIQTGLRMNHAAIVAKARGGSNLKIGDTLNGGRTMTDKTRTIMVDGLSVEIPDSAAQIVDKALKGYETQIADAATALADATKAHADAIAAKDAEMAKKDAEIDALKAKVMDDAALDARVQTRADLVAKAKAIADVETAGKTDADIRKAVVVAKLGEDAIKDKSAEYTDARFDILVEDAKPGDQMRDTFKGGLKAVTGDAWGGKIFDSAGVKMKKEA